MPSTTERVKLAFFMFIFSLSLPCLYLHSIFFWSFHLKNKRDAKMKDHDSYCISLEKSEVKRNKNSSNSFPCDVRSLLVFFTEITLFVNSVIHRFQLRSKTTGTVNTVHIYVSLHWKDASVSDLRHHNRVELTDTVLNTNQPEEKSVTTLEETN